MLVYDIEIVKAIPPKGGTREPDIDYCDGWHDHENMGISVIGAYDLDADRPRVFCGDNLGEFFTVAQDHDLLIGFNNVPFDNRVLRHHGKMPESHDRYYDLLRATWMAAGLGPVYATWESHDGYGLDAVCDANGIGSKTGHGALAPVDWQRGLIGKVIDYCLQDVALTVQLFKRVLKGEPIISPKDGSPLYLSQPFEE